MGNLVWDILKETINFHFECLVEEAFYLPMTKRLVLSISVTIYDPLGLLSPISIQMKMLFQVIFSDKTSWDTILEKKLLNLWLKILHDLKSLSHQDIYFRVSKKTLYLMNFMVFVTIQWRLIKALGCIQVIQKNDFFCQFILHKSKSCFFGKNSIPWLELLSCVLLAKLLKNAKSPINKNFEITNIFYWSDSKISLYWIRSIEKEWKQWVENRVNFIQNFAGYKSWYYVSTKVICLHVTLILNVYKKWFVLA